VLTSQERAAWKENTVIDADAGPRVGSSRLNCIDVVLSGPREGSASPKP
jgi:hypothetical protein